MHDEEAYKKTLRLGGLSVTRRRLAIMAALHGKGGTATPADLLQRLRKQHSIHKTTLYRNLDALERGGVLRKLSTRGRSFVYELDCDHRPPIHPHFTCRRCESIVCLDPVDLSSVWTLLTQDSGLKPEQAEITLTGLCVECARAEPEGG